MDYVPIQCTCIFMNAFGKKGWKEVEVDNGHTKCRTVALQAQFDSRVLHVIEFKLQLWLRLEKDQGPV